MKNYYFILFLFEIEGCIWNLFLLYVVGMFMLGLYVFFFVEFVKKNDYLMLIKIIIFCVWYNELNNRFD